MDGLTGALGVLGASAPQDYPDTLSDIVTLSGKLATDIRARVDSPLDIIWDPKANKFYVASDYNKDGDSFRSPWTNRFYPPLSNDSDCTAFTPSDVLRMLEVEYNDMFDQYRTTYFGGGVSSVYLWDDNEDLVGAFVLRKELSKVKCIEAASWDATHIIEVSRQKSAVYYRINSAVRLTLTVEEPLLGKLDLGTTLTRQHESNKKMGETQLRRQVAFVGSMIEEVESAISRQFSRIYSGQFGEVLAGLRVPKPVTDVGPALAWGRESTRQFSSLTEAVKR